MNFVRVFFSGSVQGVGFRYTARRIAQGMGIAGKVRNLPDGRVELIAEACNRPTLESFIDRLTQNFQCKAMKHFSDGASGLTAFEIVYDIFSSL